jgi:IAA-amino acid hydrolase
MNRQTLPGTLLNDAIGLREMLVEIRRATNAMPEGRLEVIDGYPVTRNDPAITGTIRDAASAILGSERIVDLPFDTWAEDFGYLTAAVPDAMFWLGVAGPAVPNPIWHSPTFDIDEDALPVGAAVMAAAAVRLPETMS